MRLCILTLLTAICLNVSAQNCNCELVFLQSKKLVEDNYAGWFDKVNSKNLKDYENWTAKKQVETMSISTDSTCAKKMQEWISFFKDKHLRILYTKPRISSNAPQQASKTNEVKILTHHQNLESAKKYFDSNKNLDPIEGFYSHPSYELAITRVEDNLFYATVLSTKNENWKPGEVKLTLQKKGENYRGVFYEGDKSDISEHDVKLIDNILDFDIVFFEKSSPGVTKKLDLTEYEIGKDKDAPDLKFKEDVAIWKFPTFYSNSEEQTAYFLNKYKERLANTPYWVIDLRNNSGGDYRVGFQLIDYIYTKPIKKYNAEKRMTAQNIDLWFSSFVKSYYDQADEKTKKVLDDRMANMRKNIGKMYNEENKDFELIEMKSISSYPKKIAILINANTVSSGELFTMLAFQSDKVSVMGENSGGMMDYGNILRYKTEQSSIRVQIPMDRMLWLNSGFSIDLGGIKPSVYLKEGDWIEQSIKRMKQMK